MFKTNFKPDLETFTYNGVTGDFGFKDIFFKNFGGIIRGNVEIYGNLTTQGSRKHNGPVEFNALSGQNGELRVTCETGQSTGIFIGEELVNTLSSINFVI